MSLLDDARRLAETDPAELVNSHSRCHWCQEFTGSMEAHEASCPWRAMTAIVQALEVLAVFAAPENWMGGEFHGPPWTFWRARQALGLEPADEDDDSL